MQPLAAKRGIRHTLPMTALPTSVKAARELTKSYLQRWGFPADTVENGETVMGELFVNAVQAAPETEVWIAVSQDAGRPLIEIWDRAPDLPRLRPQELHLDDGNLDDNFGRGLRIVDALSEEWGWRPAPVGKVVYARLRVTSFTGS